MEQRADLIGWAPLNIGHNTKKVNNFWNLTKRYNICYAKVSIL